jgi:2,3-bisphosphoglycerate-dependent phosphoglycerate mutase
MTSSPSQKASLWWLRHAESTGNLADLAAHDAKAARLELTHRDPDVPLSDAGREQAQALGSAWQHLAPNERPTMVVSSPYERAAQTAQIAMDTAGWDIPLVRDERLRERDLGMLDGYTHTGIEDEFPQEAERRAWLGKFYYRPPGGESWADVAGRVRSVLTDVTKRDGGAHVLLVTHQAVILLARYVLENLTEKQILEVDSSERLANTALTRYEADAGSWRLVAYNDTAHLDDRDAPVTDEPDATAVAR